MIIVNIYGGLGNQLFQYAAGRQLAEKNHTRLKLDIENYKRDNRRSYSLHHFNIQEKFCTPFDKKIINGKERVRKFLNKKESPAIYTEQNLSFDKKVLELGNNTYLDGYWQSEKYFNGIEKIIRTEYRMKEPLSGINKMFADKIESLNAVSIHVRRGDYVKDKNANAGHGVCGLDYYQQAIAYLTGTLAHPYFFIFSDDMEWTRTNLSTGSHPVEYIDHNAAADYEDLRLMSLCKHHIIANSSFSWWGAWLNESVGKKIIAPKKWFRAPVTNDDLIPEGWITL
jgi:Glycosyl transferase family 11